MAGKTCAFLHPNKIKRHQEREAAGKIAQLQQQAAIQEQEVAQAKSTALEQIAALRIAAQQDIESLHQTSINTAQTAFKELHEQHQEALVALSFLFFYGKAIIAAEHASQMQELLQARDIELQKIPQDYFRNLFFGPSQQYIAAQEQIHLKYEQAIVALNAEQEQRSAAFKNNYDGAVQEETQQFTALQTAHTELLNAFETDKATQDAQLDDFVANQKQNIEQQYLQGINNIRSCLQQKVDQLNIALQQQLQQFDKNRKTMLLNGGLMVGSAFISWVAPQALAGAIGSFAASTIQLSAGMSTLGAANNLFNGSGQVGFNIAIAMPTNNTKTYTPQNYVATTTREPRYGNVKSPEHDAWRGIDLGKTNAHAWNTDTRETLFDAQHNYGTGILTDNSSAFAGNQQAMARQPTPKIHFANTESGTEAVSYSTTAPYLAPKPALPPTAPPQQTGVLDWSLLAWRSFTGEQSPEVVNWQQSNRQKFPNAAGFFDSIVHSQPQRVVNAFAEQFVATAIDRPIMFLSEEVARVKLGAQTQTAQFAVQAKQTVSEIKDFVQAEIARIMTGETTETALFFEKIGNFVEADFNRLRNGQATVIGSALAADFTALANMSPEELAAYLGHEAGDAFLLFIAGGWVHYGGRAMSKAMETVHAVGREFIATHTFQPPLVFQFSGNKLYTGFPIDVVKPQKIIKRKHVTEFAVGEADLVQAEYLRRSLELQQIFTADASKQVPTSLGHSRAELKNYLKNINSVPREQLVQDLNSIGFKYTGGSGDGKYCKFTHPERGFSVRIDDVHPPKRSNGCKYQHIHLFDKQGNSLNADLKIVPPSSPDAHIKISELIKLLELKL